MSEFLWGHQNSSTSLFLLAAGDGDGFTCHQLQDVLFTHFHDQQHSPWNGHDQMVSLKIDNRKHVLIGRVIVQAYYILMTRLSQNDYFGWKSWFPSTTSSAWTDVVFKMRAAFPFIRSRLSLWKRCLVCSSASLLVWWLARCMLDTTGTASSWHPPRAWKNLGILSLNLLALVV